MPSQWTLCLEHMPSPRLQRHKTQNVPEHSSRQRQKPSVRAVVQGLARAQGWKGTALAQKDTGWCSDCAFLDYMLACMAPLISGPTCQPQLFTSALDPEPAL